MTFWIVLVLVFALIIGNMLMLRPSAEDRALGAQREKAGAAGFHVHLREAPGWLELPVGERLVACYQLAQATPADHLGRWRWHAGIGSWQRVDGDRHWPGQVPWPTPAPAGWLGVEAVADGVTVYWREDGRAESVDLMLNVLQQSGA